MMPGPTADLDAARLQRRVRGKLDDWRGLLTRSVESGRDVLRALLVGPMRFTPIVEERRRGYAFEGAIALDRLLSGEAIFQLVVRPQREWTLARANRCRWMDIPT